MKLEYSTSEFKMPESAERTGTEGLEAVESVETVETLGSFGGFCVHTFLGTLDLEERDMIDFLI